MDVHCNSIYGDGEVAWMAGWGLHPQESCAVDRSNAADTALSKGTNPLKGLSGAVGGKQNKNKKGRFRVRSIREHHLCCCCLVTKSCLILL